jgi:hypothetical protein
MSMGVGINPRQTPFNVNVTVEASPKEAGFIKYIDFIVKKNLGEEMNAKGGIWQSVA